jgi:hypothetical protein
MGAAKCLTGAKDVRQGRKRRDPKWIGSTGPGQRIGPRKVGPNYENSDSPIGADLGLFKTLKQSVTVPLTTAQSEAVSHMCQSVTLFQTPCSPSPSLRALRCP